MLVFGTLGHQWLQAAGQVCHHACRFLLPPPGTFDATATGRWSQRSICLDSGSVNFVK